VVLRFEQLEKERSDALDELIRNLPVQTAHGEEIDAGILVSEIVERHSA
jgi:hypothetical protein